MKRPCLYMGIAMAFTAVAAGHASLSGSVSVFIAGFLLILSLIILPFRNKKRWISLLFCITLAGSVLLFARFINIKTCVLPAEHLADREDICLMQVTDIPKETDYGYSLEVRLLSVGEEQCRITGILYCDTGEYLPGDLLSATCKTALASEEGKTDLRRLYQSRGQYITVSAQETPVMTGQKRDILLYPLIWAARGRNTVSKLLSGEQGNILTGILFGGGGNLSERFSDAASRSGVSHMFAVSGMHLSVLCAGLLFVFRKRSAVIPVFFAGILFAVMTGMTPSVLRAMILVLLPMTLPFLHRDTEPLNALGFALCVLLVANPSQIFSLSLQFSFAAVLGLFLYGDRLYRFFTDPVRNKGRWRFAPWRWLCAGISAYFCANLFCLPLLVLHFDTLSVLGVLANLAVVWMLPFLFAGGFLLLLLSGFFSAGAELLAKGLNILLSLLQGVVIAIGENPCATFGLKAIPLSVWFFASYGILLLLLMFRKRPAHWWLIGTALSLICTLAGMNMWGRTNTRVDFLDVGSGQCAVIIADGHTVMLDCGGKNAENTALSYLDGMNIRKVDLLILSHTDEDHINGAGALLSRGRVKKLLLSDYAARDEKGRNLISQATEGGAEVTVLKSTEDLDLSGIEMTLYSPAFDSTQKCIMTGVKLFDTRLFFSADMNFEDEKKLLYRYNLPDCDILCVAHHGAENGTGTAFLRKLAPELAVISVGKNNYGHPSEKTLSRLSKQGAEVYTTLESGELSLTVNRRGYRIK